MLTQQADCAVIMHTPWRKALKFLREMKAFLKYPKTPIQLAQAVPSSQTISGFRYTAYSCTIRHSSVLQYRPLRSPQWRLQEINRRLRRLGGKS